MGEGAIFLGNTYVQSESISRGGCACVCALAGVASLCTTLKGFD